MPHARVILFKKTKEQQHEADDVNFKNLTFGEGSPFKDGIEKWQWLNWLKEYSQDWCQEMISCLEDVYEKDYSKVNSPVKLIRTALKKGNEWRLRQQRLDKAKQSERKWDEEKAREKLLDQQFQAEEDERIFENENDDCDYAKATKQTFIINRAMDSLEKEGLHTDKENDSYQAILRHKVIQEYRKTFIK